MSLIDCWPTEKHVFECIKPEAENPLDAVFLAVHQPMKLTRKHFDKGSAKPGNEQDVLQDFLRKDVPTGTLLMPILGDSGIGKSHLVRWLDVQLRQRTDCDRRHVNFPTNSGRIVRVRRLLQTLRGSGSPEMSEAIRLLARLRQLFPRHLDNRQWQTAPTLVADYRFLLRPRVFPRRDLDFQQVLNGIQEVANLDSLSVEILKTLLGHKTEHSLKLAPFQVRAARSILTEVSSPRASGTIICAGTGSGKTLAFYLPAFLHLAPLLDTFHWTKCLAVYPRNELLKDQLSETYRQARRIDAVLAVAGRRKLTIGALFGFTPENSQYFIHEDPPRGWTSVAGGFACPYMRCPTSDCNGELVWLDSDRHAQIERLQCRSCNYTTEHDELILTRDRLRAVPPDILFTTTEMLNQRIGDSRFAHLFGIGVPANRKPSLVLLDEVHTYSGISGAQVGLLLRRWQRSARVQPHFVGLSATLADARHFFGRLVGVSDFRVDEINPHSLELDRGGAEYLLAVRGDPASGVSLLSATIQTAMLMRRVQNPNSAGHNDALFGTREFVFTDDLDVTNRLFFNLRDAEGLNSWGRPDPQKPNGSLANLRASNGPDEALRFRFGQSWKLCEDIGHVLAPNITLSVDRTSSQDVGVAPNADIIVATASLEVGFNDPDVNVVLQHKAPREAAQFVQRKGRAGRRTEMRPWTVVMLSDYGRDRLAWQSYDLLFDPALPPRDLPVSNRYALRMQAVFAFIDWLAHQLRRVGELPGGSVWRDLSAPAEQLGSSYQNAARRRQQAVANIVEDLLVRDDHYEELRQYLQEALQVAEDVVDALMWEPPRALMNAVLPTLLRRLQTNWNCAGNPNASERQQYDYYVPNNPLPEFVPGRLFSDLNLPEVTVVTPPQQQNDEAREEPLPVLQAMREYAPGRVSRRFGILNQWARHWIALPKLDPGPVEHLPLGKYLARYDELGQFQYREGNQTLSVRCVRPLELHLQQPPGNVLDTSNAFLCWNTQIVAETDGIEVDVPSPSRWKGIVEELRFYTHNHHIPLEIRRFAMASDATLTLQNGQQFESHVKFVQESPTEENSTPEPVAVGFVVNADGFVVRFRMPEDLQVSETATNQAKVRALRTAFFRDSVITDPALDGIANTFRRQWLAEVYLTAVTYTAITQSMTLSGVWDYVGESRLRLDFIEILQVIFQSIPMATDDHDREAENATELDLDELHQRLYHDLSALLNDPQVANVLHEHAPKLWQTSGEAWDEWLHRKFKTTLGAAILDAVQQLCPDLDAGDLILDIESGPRATTSFLAPDGLEEVWLTERTVGGGGIIENLLKRYGDDPRRFFDLVEAALRPSDFEIADEQLTMLLDWVIDPGDRTVRDQLAALRQTRSGSYNDFAKAFDELIRLLSERGLFVCHSVLAALSARILRPGSTVETDRMLHDVIADWRHREEQLGIDIDARVFAYLHSRDDALDHALEEVTGDAIGTDRNQWRFSALVSVLWPRGGSVRGHRLSVYNPFAALSAPEHDLVRDCLGTSAKAVSLSDSDWADRVSEALVSDSEVVLRAGVAETLRLRQAVIQLLVNPIDTGFLLLHPRVCGIERGAGGIEVTLVISEGLQ